MNFKKMLSLLALVVSASVCQAQKKEFKFGKIDPKEFEVTATGIDSGAAAIILFDVGEIYFDFNGSNPQYVFERHVRYKILNNQGYEYANHKIGLFRATNQAKEDMRSMDAATYNLVDGKIVPTKITKDAKFTEEFSRNYSYKKYALPNVKEGSIIEYKYRITSDFFQNLRGWTFQNQVPTLYSRYMVTIPEYFSYKTNFGGAYHVNKTKSERTTINIGAEGLGATVEEYILENVPALKEEAYITTLDDYRPNIYFEFRSLTIPGVVYNDYTGTWPKIVNILNLDENFGAFLKRDSYAKTVLPAIIKDQKDTLAVAKAIFNYVKHAVKWDKSYQIYASATNPKSIFEKKSGSSADINLTLLNLLQVAKINAYPLLISTRQNGAHPGYPLLTKFDNVLACVMVGDKLIYLDATDLDNPFGFVPYEDLNHQGLLINLKTYGSSWVTLEPTFNKESSIIYNLTLTPELKFKGNITCYHKGYAALDNRSKHREVANETEFIKNYKKSRNGLSIEKYELGNLDSLDNMLTEQMQVEIADNIEEAGDLIYFTPLLYERTKENLFKHDTRLFPVDFGYPQKENFRLFVKFPENYQIEKLPKSGTYKLPNDKGTFSINFVVSENTLLVKSLIDIPDTLYAPDDYFYLKELFKTIVEKQSEQIVFKKKS